MHLAFGSLSVTIKHTYPRGNSTIYQRSVPVDLRDRYPSATIKKTLPTNDPVKVAKMVDQLNRQLAAEWAGLRASPTASPQTLTVHADKFLADWGLKPTDPTNDPAAIELLYNHFDDKRGQFAGRDDEAYRAAHPTDYLTPVEEAAWKRLHTKPPARISDALDVYLETHTKRDNATFTTNARRTVGGLIKLMGDKAIADFTRDDARRYVALSLEGGAKTTTVRRHLNVYVAMWGVYKRERDQSIFNPFEKLAIAGEGEDSDKRDTFAPDQLKAIYAACVAKDDDCRWLFALMIDTGARLAEMAGLALSDIKLDAPIPHVVIQPHPWRSLKNKNSAREVPLVGATLWAAKRICANATKGQRFAFPRYTKTSPASKEGRCNSNTASATLIKWVKSLGIDGLNHELRHTLSDRLREVECPKPIMGAIDGHGRQDIADGYGHGYSLKVKQEWLARVALQDVSTASAASTDAPEVAP